MSNFRLTAALLTALLPVISPTAADAQVVETTVNVSPTADASVHRWYLFTNYGADSTILAHSIDKPEPARTLIKFDTAAISSAIGTRNLVSAKLKFTLTTPAVTTVPTGSLNVFPLTRTWAESTVSWNSLFPAFTAEPYNEASPTSITSVANGATGSIELDVTRDVLGFVGGATNYGWIVKDNGVATGVNATFHSRESASSGYRPVLVIKSVDGVKSGSPLVTFGASGILTVDASSNNDYLNFPTNGLTFASNAALLSWAVTNLNAKYSYDASGNINGATGRLTQYGDIYTADAAGNIYVVEDFAAAKLGGQTLRDPLIFFRENGPTGNFARVRPV